MRRGGWRADRQRQFIALLAETGSVRAAYRRLGVGEHHIYKLRNHPEAASYVTPDEVRARIDKKITEVRCRVEKEQAAMWARLSDETNAAWERFVERRERDLDAVGATEDERALMAVQTDTGRSVERKDCSKLLSLSKHCALLVIATRYRERPALRQAQSERA